MKPVYEVWGNYSGDQYLPSFIDEFENREDAENCVNEFNQVHGRNAWIEHR